MCPLPCLLLARQKEAHLGCPDQTLGVTPLSGQGLFIGLCSDCDIVEGQPTCSGVAQMMLLCMRPPPPDHHPW